MYFACFVFKVGCWLDVWCGFSVCWILLLLVFCFVSGFSLRFTLILGFDDFGGCLNFVWLRWFLLCCVVCVDSFSGFGFWVCVCLCVYLFGFGVVIELDGGLFDLWLLLLLCLALPFCWGLAWYWRLGVLFPLVGFGLDGLLLGVVCYFVVDRRAVFSFGLFLFLIWALLILAW